MACCLLLLLQGGLALGSTEARRVARPVSGLRCSGTLSVHILAELFLARGIEMGHHGPSRAIGGGHISPLEGCTAPGLIELVLLQQLHAGAELPPDRMNELPHPRPHRPSALPWAERLYMAALALLNHIPSPIVQVVN